MAVLVLGACARLEAGPPPTPAGAGVSAGTVFYDSFEQDAGVWDVYDAAEASAVIADGELGISVTDAGQVAISLVGFNLSDFDLSVDAVQAEGPVDNGYGIIFRYLGPDDFYRFDISGDGHWGLSRYVNDDWTLLVPLTASDAIRPPGETNTLRVVMQGTTAQLFVNGVNLHEAEVLRGTGRVGLFASSFDAANVRVQFDNVTVRNP